MAYNTDCTRFKSVELAGVDCGSYLKISHGSAVRKQIAVYDGDLEIGQCVAMVRVPAGAIVVGGRLSWQGTTASHLGVGDPFACGRFVTVFTASNSQINAVNVSGYDCGTFTSTGRTGDGCGLFYKYTCETDVMVYNLYGAPSGAQGGWAGGSGANSGTVAAAKWTGGRIVLVFETSLP